MNEIAYFPHSFLIERTPNMKNKPTIFALSMFLCISSSLYSNNNAPPPPVNDICSGAVDLGLIECEFYADFVEDPEATPDVEATGNCINNTEPAQWYTFTTTSPMEYGTIVHFTPTVKIEIFSTTSDCSDLVYEDCGMGPFGFKPQPATTYYYLTTGGLHIQPPSSGLSTCDNPLVSFNYMDNPVVTASYTDCAAFSGDVVCENEHVIWIGYTVGCGESSDVLIEVSPYSFDPSITANEISITVVLWNCNLLLSEYDANGLGYVCSAIGAGESINLLDVPPGLSFVIGFGSNDNNAGYFSFNITETNTIGTVFNDECIDAEPLDTGINNNLSNSCALPDMAIPECGPQSEATVWYEYDQGTDLQTLLITLFPIGIENPAIAVYNSCNGDLIGSVCGTSLELECIDFPVIIQIGSSLVDAGLFDLDIENSASLPAIEPIIIGTDICSEELAGITIDIPGGEIVDITVEVAPWSSIAISGMTNQTYTGVNSATINDILFNNSSIAQEAIYLITVSAPEGYCPADQIEFSIMVYPGFTTNEFSLDECLPFVLDINVSQLIMGGTMPYASTTWNWNSTEVLGTDHQLTVDLEESGVLTLVVVDAEGCTKSATIDIELTPTVTPTFDFPLSYCRSKQDVIVFPVESLESIAGSWSSPSFDLNIFLNDGTYNITFTADEPHCILPVVLSIQIHSGDDPVFDLPEFICTEEIEYTFPTEDINGLTGTWDIPILDVSSITGMQTNIFTPISEDCYAPYEYIFEIPASIDLSFGQPANLCRIDEPYTLSNMSLEGYEGTWDVPIIDPNLIVGDSFTSTWSPIEGQAPCLFETTVTIQITEPLVPEFSLLNELCALDGNYTLPTADNQSINGTWSMSIIDPSGLSGNIEVIFTSTDYCVETYTWEIEIVEPLVPEFSIDLELCSLDEILILPLVSDNGIPGTWTQPTIDPSMNAGTQIMIEFVGDPTEFCVEPIELLFEITEALDPSFILTNQLCWTDQDLILPLISTNGIEGIWTPDVIDVQSNLGAIINSTFSPTDGSCSNEEIQSFEIFSPFVVDPIVTDPTDCAIEDGSILMDIIQGVNLEFSIDNGTSWQSTTTFSLLGSGGFTILVRSTDLEYCALTVDAFLSSPDGPVINEVLPVDISSCIAANGSITLDATGNNLEYSIDDGATWQTSNEFNNLSVGDYMISIREVMSDCVVDVSASIMDFPQTEIVGVDTQDLSDCNTDDGQIVILAEGESLEYSIDNGITWSTQNTFINLPNGQYPIMVLSTLGEDCIATMDVELIAPDMPSIINIDIGNPTICAPSTGRLEIEAEGLNLEYSIDGGMTWQSSNIFTDLMSNVFQVIVRDSERINCIDEESAPIILEDESLAETTFILTPPSICDADDAKIEVTNTTAEVEYSIDGGMTWQSTNVFDNLLAGDYTIITRKVALPDCLIEQIIEIPNSDCPCRDLIVVFDISNTSCSGENVAKVELISIQGMYDSDIDILWQNGETGLSIEGVGEGWQVVKIEYDEKCDWMDSIWVDIIKPIQFEWNVQDLDCPDINNGVIEIFNVTGGRGTFEYSLDGSNYQTESLFSDLEEGSYEVYVRDNEDCLTTNTIDVFSQPQINIELPEIDTIVIGDIIVIDPGINSSRIDNFMWSPIDGILNPNELIIQVSLDVTTTYTLEIYYDACFESKEITIQVFEKEKIHVGNVFSPDGDGVNDILYIQGVANSTIVVNDFSIYDRWGNKIFDKSQPEFNNKIDGWNGQYNGQLAMIGVFVYSINFVQDGQAQTKIGTVTLVY